MTSPDVFRSTPRKATRCELHPTSSSSPDLPPLQDLLSQNSAKPPPFKSRNSANVGSKDSVASFQSARSLWQSAQAVDSLPVDLVANDHDASASVIEVAAEAFPKARKPQSKTTAPKRTEESTEATDSSTDRSWKKYKTKAEIREEDGLQKEQANLVDEVAQKPPVRRRVPKKKTGFMSGHFQNASEPQPTSKARKAPTDEPLRLEQAIARRMDWTPPKERLTVQTDLTRNPAVAQNVGSSMDTESRGVFENLQAAFSCGDVQKEPAVVISDEDSSFMRKRKLVEMVVTPTTRSDVDPVEELSESRPKTKAPKKKARTITELATSAYRPASEPEPEPDPIEVPSAAMLDCIAQEESTGVDTKQPKGRGKEKGKLKAKAAKKATKATKKKAPPKSVLHSPSTALKEMAAQDFVFGTSSQLVREESPTFLRDLQAAIKNSNQSEAMPLDSGVDDESNASNMRPSKLWCASARDTDGDLFDVSIIDLATISTKPSETLNVSIPGYQNGEESLPSLPKTQAASTAAEDSFEKSPQAHVSIAEIPKALEEDDSFFSSSQISVSSNVGKRATPAKQPLGGGVKDAPAFKADERIEQAPAAQASKLDYETFTDAQLSKKIAAFGFKPVKRRTAMISLLNQCQQNTALTSHGKARSASTLAASKSTSPATATTTSPRPRGRPRKNSIDQPMVTSESPAKATETPRKPRGRPRKTSITDLTGADPLTASAIGESPKRARGRPRKSSLSSSPIQIQQPPPSAQPSGSPRGSGRPRKNAPSPTKPGSSRAKASQKAGGPQASLPQTPKRKAAAFKAMVEIPDSASEDGSDVEVPRCSSPDTVDSPSSVVDMSASVEEVGDLSLMVGATDKDANLFRYITKAVKATPRTTDPLKPSWYEKMLMYDPIVLEDLTSWLNQGQLDKVGYDGEVSPGLVKKWCESKSVCCLWRVNLRGKERKRY